MRFQVPQFIDVEDRIFGPLTLKQFIYLAGGAGLSFLIYVLLGSIFLSTVPVIIVIAISCALAFYKINGKPLITIVEAAFKYIVGSKLYIWRKENTPSKEEKAPSSSYASLTVPKISDSKLKDLSWSLDVKEHNYPPNTQ